MSSLRTSRRPVTGDFQTDVRTVLPFHVTSRGRPTFTESNRGMRTSSKRSVWLEYLPGEPVIDTEPPRTGADQPDREEHVQDFRKVQEIVDPVKRRKSFRHGGNLGHQGGDKHIDQ